MDQQSPQYAKCRATEGLIGRSTRTIKLENNLVSITVLPDKGAEINSLLYKPKNMNVLWEAPWSVKEISPNLNIASDSATTWLEHYGGGWQEIFPNAGDECTYKGVKLSFHGEASLLPWTYEIIEQSDQCISISFSVTLFRSPFSLVRTMSLEYDKAVLVLNEKVRNEANETIEFIWGHHPAFGAPFISEDCVVDTGAKTILADDRYDGPGNILPRGSEWKWPNIKDINGKSKNLSRLPAAYSGESCLAYLKDFQQGWFSITNQKLGFGVGFCWPKEVFPYAFYWEEAHDSKGFPFYGRAYTVAIEPFSSIPGQGLVNLMQKTGSQLRLDAGGSIEADLCIVFFEGSTGVNRIFSDGKVDIR